MLIVNVFYAIILGVTSLASTSAIDVSPLRGGFSSEQDNMTLLDFEPNEFEMANVTSRQLSDYWYPKKWGYACRHDHPSYHVYDHYSFGECKHKCRENDWCKAFEYYDYNDRCELWKVVPTYFKSKHGFSCYVKKHHYDDDEDDWRDDYYENSNKACRTRRGKQGSKNHDWYRWTGKSLHWCQAKCHEYGDECKGFEYKHYNTKHCEIWLTYPKKTEYKKGYSCYKKKY